MENLTAPWQRLLDDFPFQTYVFGTHLAGTQPFAKLSIIIQICLSDPTGVFLITMHGSLPNVAFLNLSHKSQKKIERHFHAKHPSSPVPLDEQGWASEAVSRMSTPANPAFPTALPHITNHTSCKIPPYVTYHSSPGPALAELSRLFPTINSSHPSQGTLS